MNLENIVERAREIRKQYNPGDLAIFPYGKISSDIKNLNIFSGDLEDDSVLGAITYKSDNDTFNIYINSTKNQKRRYFTTAHELGHYFLHQDELKRERLLVDPESLFDGNKALFNLTSEEMGRLEIEANHFAMNLVAPDNAIRKVWDASGNPEKCADFFNIPLSLMSARLEKLGLIGK